MLRRPSTTSPNAVTMIGDRLTCERRTTLTSDPGIQIDAVVSRQLKMEWRSWDRYLQSGLQKYGHCLGTNTVSNYKELLDQLKTSKRPSLDPCDTIWWVDMPTISPVNRFKARLYELELAKKYDFITIGLVPSSNWKSKHLGGNRLCSLQYGNQWWGTPMLKQSKKPLDKAEKVRLRSKTMLFWNWNKNPNR